LAVKEVKRQGRSRKQNCPASQSTGNALKAKKAGREISLPAFYNKLVEVALVMPPPFSKKMKTEILSERSLKKLKRENLRFFE
jgi:hypothetical protein